MKKIFLIVFILASILNLAACGMLQLDTDKVKIIEQPEHSDTIVPGDLEGKGEVLQADTEEYIKSLIDASATEVLTALKDYDMDKLSQLVHPEKGVRFSPYGYVDAENNLVFDTEAIKGFGSDDTQYLWGSYDGSGDPIKLTFKDYYKKFIYDVDFLSPEQIGYNKALGQGNSLNNSFEFYKNAIIVEYYFSGFDPQYEDMDWRSLRLVFEKVNGGWYLVGIIHDQWTI